LGNAAVFDGWRGGEEKEKNGGKKKMD